MRILLVTDTHLAEQRPAAVANWEAVRAFAVEIQPDLTVHLGDITRDGWSAPEELGFAADLARGWPSAIRFIPGNHDVGDNPPGPGVDFKQPLSDNLLGLYRARFGADFWAQDHDVEDGPGWRLLGLNAQLFASGAHDEDEQWAWLEDQVNGAAGRNLVIFCHKPLFQNDLFEEPPHIRYVPTAPRRRLLELLEPTRWRFWLSGHTHQFWDRTVAGARHIWVPSAAYRFPAAMQEKIGDKIVGVGVLTLNADNGRFELVAPDGIIQEEYPLQSPPEAA
jgi:3',5'-cyclic AMP phosphodiesterase CpdA